VARREAAQLHGGVTRNGVTRRGVTRCIWSPIIAGRFDIKSEVWFAGHAGLLITVVFRSLVEFSFLHACALYLGSRKT